MIKNNAIYWWLLPIITLSSCAINLGATGNSPVSHDQWDSLLKNHVKENGFVDYMGFISDSNKLVSYTQLLASVHPDEKSWSREEQMAYWINAYNAYTVLLIVRNYPVASIKDIKNGIPFVNTVWDIKWIELGGYTYDLNNIEHNILRPVFKDARIHAAVNCASYSCPALRNEAFTAKRLNEQLDDSMQNFIEDKLRNQIIRDADTVYVSEIFKWFSGDFKDASGSSKAFIEKYTGYILPDNIQFIEYDWRLNDITR